MSAAPKVNNFAKRIMKPRWNLSVPTKDVPQLSAEVEVPMERQESVIIEDVPVETQEVSEVAAIEVPPKKEKVLKVTIPLTKEERAERVRQGRLEREAIYKVFPKSIPCSVIKRLCADLQLPAATDYTDESKLKMSVDDVCAFIGEYQEVDPREADNAKLSKEVEPFIDLFYNGESDKFFTLTPKQVLDQYRTAVNLRVKNFQAYLRNYVKESQKKKQ